MNSHIRNGERGIALLIVLFALLLLTVIGLGMMYSTNMETSINSNYRDKQGAFYAAIAGLQEARDRIQPATHNIVAPTDLPSTSFANVIYIVANASTVKPWDPTNAYFDTELCQENILGLTHTAGIPCTAAPYGSSWYQAVNDSLASSTPWNLTNPLDLKWTRITLKGNNMTPVAVNGNSASSYQACWNGVNEMSTPTGYSTGCLPIGGVTSVTVVTSGSAYTTTPSVSFAGGGGTGAAATAALTAETTGYVASIAVTTGGSGYTSLPTVTVSTGTGTAATATAVFSAGSTTVTGGTVASVTVTAGGSGYTTAPTVSFGGPGSGATAVAVLSSSGTTVTAGYVSSITLTTGGSAYTSAPTVSFSNGNATATATLGTTGSVKSVALSSPGTQCYSQASDVQIAFSGGGGSGASATATLETTRSCIYSWTAPSSPQCTNKLNAADGYSPIDQKSTVTFNDVGNKSFSGTLYVRAADEKSPSSFSVENPGYDSSGYSAATFTSKLTLTSGNWPTHAGAQDCNNITATATTGYRIASINVTSAGSGYTSTPTVSITGGVGSTSNPTATATRGFPVASITLTSGGNGYNTTPTVSFSGGNGSGAAATAAIVTNSTTVYPVASINVTAGGNGYSSAPTVTLSGGSGTGAAGTANITTTGLTTYSIASITVNGGGTGYDPANPPTVTISGGGGSGATATATISTMPTGNYWVDHITVSTPGSGYTSNPTVTISGGGGSGATATAQISGGTKFGQVYLVTSFAQTHTGARSMLQTEVATPVLGFATGGALTLDGPNPVIDAMPNSNLFTITGADANSCHETQEADHPAIDGYDDPNATPPTNSVTTIVGSLPRPDHYTGSGGTPSVQNGYAALGETMTTPTGLQSLLGAIYNAAPVASRYTTATSGGFVPGSTTKSSITYVDGNLTLSGNPVGSGILVVTGTLTMTGNFTWQGLVFVVGDGIANMSGGGNANVTGSMIVSKIWDSYTTKNLLSSIGSPTFNWNGGGGNGIHYDHCYVTDLMTAVPFTPPPTTKPLKVLSFRILPY